MTSRVPFYFLIAMLVVVGLSLNWYRHDVYGVPWTPNTHSNVWEVEARIQFDAHGDPIKVSLASPTTQSGFTLIDESTSSPGYGVATIDNEQDRRTEWSIREAQGPQTLYYKAMMLTDNNADYSEQEPVDPIPVVNLPGPQDLAATALIEQAKKQSADNQTFTREIIKQFNNPDNQNAALLLHSGSRPEMIVNLLHREQIHARIAGGLNLEDGRRRQSIMDMIEIWNGNKWVLFNPKTGAEGKTDNLFIWNQNSQSLLDVMGGKNSQVHFSMIAQDIAPQKATEEKIRSDDLLNFSIHTLPLEEQSMFKTIMLIPIGALIVVFLRVIVGLKTSGTFMPVLIAVAFVQTQLVTGIIGFLLIVGTGLFIRGYLSKLNLLLVARISAVIISVIIIIAMFTVLAFKLGLNEGLTITFFPMIILSWTVERMSILWEEEGPKEVFIQGGGSMLTAIIIYIAMTNDIVRHLTFNFIGVQLIIMAVILLLGNYTGYRLSELRRFKPLSEE
ncbi:inactive transglutaminase family protein [Vibrio sp. SS-MA-C1-2]|uniref:inactive transglutaminase family protein n=1 Tax=Vibrio sp. SS-MA-C1-2 TaxID=2908646 RepID=UPI001F410757|nr:inactive transglutaminase family protein [Vibrio sp. SS-MA-C1-2]UJF18635.1 inactive transglutaminase family protein [Vibrio sp. SS-MA-C1-2]